VARRLRATQVVSGSETQLSRVVTNLIANARRAMADAGRLGLVTADVYLDKPLGGGSGLAPGAYVRLEVSDTGTGIAPEIRERIFEPFFTTDARQGSGLGLSIVQAIVEDHRGAVTFETEVGRGTRFRVLLPAFEVALPPRPAPDVPGGSERILVVDDDPIQRETLSRILRHLGYRVSLAPGGEAAVAWLRRRRAELVILDMVMPQGIDGCETYRRLAALRPGQRAIIVSGSARSERVREAQALGAGAFVRKPLTVGRLAREVRAALEPAGR
jgi:CheY-like chemotaxis protein